MLQVIILKPNESGKSAFAQVVKQFGILKNVIATGNILITEPVTKGQMIEIPLTTKVSTRVSESTNEATGEVQQCTWLVLE